MTTNYIQHNIERILNDPLHPDAVKAYSTRTMQEALTLTGIKLHCGRNDLITTIIKDKKVTQALSRADILYIDQLITADCPMNIQEFDAPVNNLTEDDEYASWGRTVLKHIRKWHRTQLPATTQLDNLTDACIEIWTDGSLKD